MLTTVNNKDIAETLSYRGEGELEDAIFLAADKVKALCAMQSQLELSENTTTHQTRLHYAMIMEEQVNTLRTLLDRHFG